MGSIASKGAASRKAGRVLKCRTAPLRGGYKQETFCSVELLYRETEENGILVYTF
jgi:hypothetical protein